MTCSSEAGVNADFKPVDVDIPWWETDRTNRVSESNRTSQLQQGDVSSDSTGVIIRVTNHSRYAGVDCVLVQIRSENSSQSHSQLWRWPYSTIKHSTVQCSTRLNTSRAANCDIHGLIRFRYQCRGLLCQFHRFISCIPRSRKLRLKMCGRQINAGLRLMRNRVVQAYLSLTQRSCNTATSQWRQLGSVAML